jgi:hypothetical protein
MADKAHEHKLRRAAERQGLKLEKARRRDRRAVDYGRFRLIDRASGEPVFPSHDLTAYPLSLHGVERALIGE